MDENLHVGDVCVFAPILAISMRSDAFEKAFFHIFPLATQNHIYKIAMTCVVCRILMIYGDYFIMP